MSGTASMRAIDDGGVMLSTHRLAYDHHTAAAGMRRFGHANGYARTLVTGLWPSLDILPARRARGNRPAHPRADTADRTTLACAAS